MWRIELGLLVGLQSTEKPVYSKCHGTAQIGFRDCRANSSSSPATEYHGTAEIGFRDCTAKRSPSKDNFKIENIDDIEEVDNGTIQLEKNKKLKMLPSLE